MYVLGVETSCDETAAGVMGPQGPVSDVTWTQLEHIAFGGVVPEIASRAHAERIASTVGAALSQAGIQRPDAVAATAGPGLIGAVLVGLSFARAAAWAWKVPFLPVNHLEGHLLSPLVAQPDLPFPFLALVVSGGHTAVYLAREVGVYETLGRTVDDAAGEAYDKVARLLGLGYPGGPIIDRLSREGDPSAIHLPRPRAPAGTSSLNMSFSGLKTAVRTAVERDPGLRPQDLAAAFQEAVVDVLCDRVLRAADATGVRVLAVSGGVAANRRLRERLQGLPLRVSIPPFRYCTDNGLMVANAGRLRWGAGRLGQPTMAARPVWDLEQVGP